MLFRSDVYYDDGFDDDGGPEAGLGPARGDVPRGYEPRGPEWAGDMRVVQSAPEPYANEPTVRTIPRDAQPSQPSAVTVSPGLMRSATSARVHVVEPRGFNEAQEVGDRLKAGQPVIINLQGVDNELKRRLIDFSSGLTYAIGGSMSRVSDQVFLLTPVNTEVSPEEKERLQARGLYRA